MNSSKKHGIGSESEEDDDDDRLSTTSSVESMNIILYPSDHIVEQLKRDRKQKEESSKAIDKKLGEKNTSKKNTKDNFRCEKRKEKKRVILEPSASKRIIKNDSSDVSMSQMEYSKLQEKPKKNVICGKYIKKGQVISKPSAKIKRNDSSEESVSQKSSKLLCKQKSKNDDTVKTSYVDDKSISVKRVKKGQVISKPSAKIKRNDSSEESVSQKSSKLLCKQKSKNNDTVKTSYVDDKSISVKRIAKNFKPNILAGTSNQKSACKGKEKKTETVRGCYEEKGNVTETVGESSSNFPLPTSFDHGISKRIKIDEKNLHNSSASRLLKSGRLEKLKNVKDNDFQSLQVSGSNTSQSSSDPKSISTVKRIPKKSNMLAGTSNQKSACKEKKTETVRESYEEKKKVTETVGENSNFPLPNSFDHSMSKKIKIDDENLCNSSASRSLKSDRSDKCKHVKGNNYQSSQVPGLNTSQSSSDPQASTSMKSAESYDDPFGNVSLYNYLIKQIVGMDTNWLHKEDDRTVPPFIKNVEDLPLFFTSHPVYVNSFLPLMILEIWGKICQESKPILLSKSQNKFNFSVTSFSKDNDLFKLQCESYVDNTLSYFPCDKSVVILDCVDKTGIFGFVTHDEKFLSHEILQNPIVVHFNIHVKLRPSCFSAEGEIIEANGICSLADELKLIDSLSSLRLSAVLSDILKPTWDTFFVPCTELLSTHDFMSIQNIICNVVVDAMKLPATCKKIILLEGPPGSGKTEVIPRICEKLVCNEKFCIFITAPTDLAVDGIANKFIELNNTLSTTNIRFLRLGDPQSICETVKPHSLPWKLEVVREKWEKRYSDWQSQNDQVIKNISHHHPMCAWNEIIEEKERRKICTNANVILTKLEDVSEVSKYGFKFSCCFIDEINQATEVESLLPFTLQISKFFIIGDLAQLPPVVKSGIAIDYRLQRSILERFEDYFDKRYQKSPVINLTDQFRMHKEISSFPLSYFYGYVAHSFSNHRSENWPLQPYVVVDDHSYLKDSSQYTKTGVNTIIKMCLFMLGKFPAASIGVIVPSQYEKELYLLKLNQITSSNIEIDTVEGFQGREKSVVVLSCYHDSFLKPDSIFTCKRRLNVALTRAYCSLIICGPIHLIYKCPLPDWKCLIADAETRKCYRKLLCFDSIPDIFITQNV